MHAACAWLVRSMCMMRASVRAFALALLTALLTAATP